MLRRVHPENPGVLQLHKSLSQHGRGMPCDQQLAPRRQGNCKCLQKRGHRRIDTEWPHMIQLLLRSRSNTRRPSLRASTHRTFAGLPLTLLLDICGLALDKSRNLADPECRRSRRVRAKAGATQHAVRELCRDRPASSSAARRSGGKSCLGRIA